MTNRDGQNTKKYFLLLQISKHQLPSITANISPIFLTLKANLCVCSECFERAAILLFASSVSVTCRLSFWLALWCVSFSLAQRVVEEGGSY